MRRDRAALLTREQVLDDLRRELDDALATSGRAVFVACPRGEDLVEVARAFAADARHRHAGLRVVFADAADPEHAAWRQVALRLTGKHRLAGVARRTLEDWVGAVPGIGGLLSAIVATFRELATWRASRDAGGAAGPIGTGHAVDDVRALLAHGAREPRLIVLERLEASDADELSGAFALIQRIEETRTLLLATCVGTAAGLSGRANDLAREAERLKRGRRLVLAPAAGDGVAGAFAANPDDPDRLLLAAAALIGVEFDSVTLARVLGRAEDDVDNRLARLAREGVFSLTDTVERDDGMTDVYAFADDRDVLRFVAGCVGDERETLRRRIEVEARA